MHRKRKQLTSPENEARNIEGKALPGLFAISGFAGGPSGRGFSNVCFYNAFPGFLGREKMFLRELSDPRPLSPPKSEKDRKIAKKVENLQKKLSQSIDKGFASVPVC